MRGLNILKQIDLPTKSNNQILKTDLDRTVPIEYDNLFNQNEVRKTNLDLTNRDYITGYENPETYAGGIGLNEIRAVNQPNFDKVLSGTGRVLNKAVSEIAKMPGVVAGVIASPFAEEGKGFETAFNNEWIKSINKISEDINTDLLPVYVKKAVSEGNLWDNISSVDFWATDGADGIGFIVSMLAPGAALKSIGLGEKVLGTTAKGLSLINGESKLAGATRTLTELGITADRLELGSMTMANSMFEAGSEAGSAMEAFQNNLDKQLQAGAINQDEYNSLLEQKGKLGRDIFLSNMAILIGPNAIQSKMLFGKAGAKQLTKELAPSILNKAGNRLKNIGGALASEGFFEEGLQTTVENTFSNSANKGELTDNFINDFNIGELASGYLDTISSTDGQKAIFLGGVLGGGMSAVAGAKEDIYNRNKTNTLLSLAESQVNNFNNIKEIDPYNRDTEGNILKNEDGSIQYDPIKVNKITKSLAYTEQQNKLFEEAIQKGDKETVQNYKDDAINQLIIPFITQGEMGINALRQYLEESVQDPNISTTDKNNENKDFVEDIIQKATYLQNQYTSYKDFSSELIDLENPNATEEDYKDFYNTLGDIYMNLKGDEYTQRKRLDELNKNKSEVLREISNNQALLEDNENYVEGEEEIYKKKRVEDPRVKKLNDLIKSSKDKLKSIDEIINGTIWNKEEVNKTFDKILNKNNKLREENSPENITKVNEEIANVDDAVTPEQLEEVKPTNPIVKEKAKTKKELLNLQQEVQAEERKQAVFKEQNDPLLEAELQIIPTYEKGREFMLPSNHPRAEEFVKFDRLEGENAIGIDNNGDEVTIPLSNKPIVNNPTIENSTDGVDDSVPVVSNENKLEVPKGRGLFTGAKVISTDRQGNKLDFISQDYLDYERTPRNKKGEKVNFEINNSRSDANWVSALNKFYSGDFSDRNLLYNHLPIDIKFTDSIYAPIETLPRTKDAQIIFNETTLPLRKIIIDSLAEGNNIENITSIIDGQYEGSLKVQDQIELPDGRKLTPENSILELQSIRGLDKQSQLEYLVNNLYMVNWTGSLESVIDSEKLIPVNYKGKGEIYLQIPMNNGKPFNLKLNFKRLEESKGAAIYDLLRIMSSTARSLQNPIGRDTTLGELRQSNNELYERLFNDNNGILLEEAKLYYQNEVKGVRKNKDSITLNDIMDILVFKNSTNNKTLMNIDIDGNLNLGSLAFKTSISRVELEENTPETQQIVLDFLKNKRYNILVTKGEKGINFNNPSYLNYILNNNILSTNAVVNEPTFQGYSNIYISSNPKDIKIQKVVKSENPIPLDSGLDSINILTEDEISSRIQNETNELIESKIGKSANPIVKMKAAKELENEINLIRDKYYIVKKESNNIYTPNSQEINQMVDTIEKNTPVDEVNVTDNIISELTERLGSIDSDIIEALSKSSNKEIYSELVKLANQREVDIEDIQKRCK